ncbi:antitoxin of toxin-antitoxin stability system [Rhizobium sp. TH2]|uniref:antitoxin of toxin-antitoxin stability system n=1 Tax=Rhizobium sp. TH2 TaxID=2775403 RepID=UPI002157A6C7|nr:antitoxin of toxin-antitoxin stability system [Rhizobium sp. TH2]UVC10872.1 antitoxin of toxin-antitoxin stability system [Rhizobium sp. TH2]
MTKNARLILDIDADLHDAFLAAAEAENRPASDIVRDFMSDYVGSHEKPDAEYWAFVERKVEAARKSLRAGKGLSNAEVEAKFAARRAAIANKNA